MFKMVLGRDISLDSFGRGFELEAVYWVEAYCILSEAFKFLSNSVIYRAPEVIFLF